MPVTAEELTNTLKAGLPLTHLEIVDDSDGCGEKYSVLIVSEVSRGYNPHLYFSLPIYPFRGGMGAKGRVRPLFSCGTPTADERIVVSVIQGEDYTSATSTREPNITGADFTDSRVQSGMGLSPFLAFASSVHPSSVPPPIDFLRFPRLHSCAGMPLTTIQLYRKRSRQSNTKHSLQVVNSSGPNFKERPIAEGGLHTLTSVRRPTSSN